MLRVELPQGRSHLTVAIPDDWLAEVVHPRPLSPDADATTLVTSALDHPIGTPPLAQLAGAGQRVAIIVDDYTRKTPIALMLPPVLEGLLAAGIEPGDIRIVVALGTHRPMTQEELAIKLGAEVAERYQVVNLSSTTEAEMIYLGTASNGIPAWVSRTVAEADLRIGLGMITPHADAGFSGGAKIILPGVCSSKTVVAFHAASAFLSGNPLGDIDAPLRRSLEQFVAERAPLDMIANAILTPEGEVYRCVAGHAVRAHRVGVEYAKSVFATPVRRRYPVVVANCYPYDVDWWQSIKGAMCGDLITAPGGSMVLVTAAPEGHSTYPLVPHYTSRDTDELRREIQSGRVEDANQAVAGVIIGRLKERVKLVLVSDGLTEIDAQTMGITHLDSLEEAISDAVTRLPEEERAGSVAIIPQAGIILPMVNTARH
jgi:nickel-dependent lactate racemase